MMKRQFEEIDTNGDGKISLTELAAFFHPCAGSGRLPLAPTSTFEIYSSDSRRRKMFLFNQLAYVEEVERDEGRHASSLAIAERL
jgi:hypothetical protein